MESKGCQRRHLCTVMLIICAGSCFCGGTRHKMFPQPIARSMALAHEHTGNDSAAMLADVHEELLKAALAQMETTAEPTYIPDSTASADVTTAHNTLRARHGSGPLVWDEALARLASKYATQCVFKPHPDSKAGQNIFLTGMTDASNTTFLTDAVNMWYTDGAAKYNYNNPGFSSQTGAFTQIVWKSSYNLGCAIQRCRTGVEGTPYDDGTLVICLYSPPGNVAGMFASNVLPPSSP